MKIPPPFIRRIITVGIVDGEYFILRCVPNTQKDWMWFSLEDSEKVLIADGEFCYANKGSARRAMSEWGGIISSYDDQYEFATALAREKGMADMLAAYGNFQIVEKGRL